MVVGGCMQYHRHGLVRVGQDEALYGDGTRFARQRETAEYQIEQVNETENVQYFE